MYEFSREDIDAMLFQLMRLGVIDIELSSKLTARAQYYLYEKLNNPDKTFDEIYGRPILLGENPDGFARPR